ncbi:hypothetical protein B0H10DRAFT_1946184 [Mycena sp. CBHHK59/15]|nr:hypothetical protein B0H10DRAFT_1946184 [Mycena sp. CBHHK59/15]
MPFSHKLAFYLEPKYGPWTMDAATSAKHSHLTYHHHPMPPAKRKAKSKCANLIPGGFRAAKRSKACSSKENVTVYAIPISTGSGAENEPTVASIPVLGAHAHGLPPDIGSEQWPETPPLRPSYDVADDPMPDLVPVVDSDDEEDDLHEDPAAFWEQPGYAAAVKLRLFADPDYDEDMFFEDLDDRNLDERTQRRQDSYGSPRFRPRSSSLLHHSIPDGFEVFKNPWDPSNTSYGSEKLPTPPPLSAGTSSQPMSNNPWRFNFSGDVDYDGDSSDTEGHDSEPEDADEEDSDDEEEDTRDHSYSARIPPTIEEAQAALKAIGLILRPPRDTGAGYKKSKLDLLLRTRLEWMQSFLHGSIYILMISVRLGLEIRGRLDGLLRHWKPRMLLRKVLGLRGDRICQGPGRVWSALIQFSDPRPIVSESWYRNGVAIN